MSHSPVGHSHLGHSHEPSIPESIGRSFVLGIVLNVLMVLLGAGVGIWSHSLALLSDAGHNLSDVASLLLALWGFKLSKAKSNERYTYGYKKMTILTSLLNAIILLGVTLWILMEAIFRIRTGSTQVPGLWVSLVAFLGIIINSGSALLFIKQKDKDLNVKGAYLHMVSDALVSFGVVITGVLIFFTHWYLLDPIISILISGIVLWGTWGLLIQSIRLSLDGVPASMRIVDILDELNKIPGIKSAHHIHVWAISTNQFAITAHLVLNIGMGITDIETIKSKARHSLEHLGISHATLEIDTSDTPCEHKDC
jgi:cobalt-zinc-cadmium efflux system protein